MKIIYTCMIMIFSHMLIGQELPTIDAISEYTFDFGVEVQDLWKKRDQLLTDINEGVKDWNTISSEEKALLEKYGEVYESMWDALGGGCSWYCGAGGYTVSTSSTLSSQGKHSYSATHIQDFNYETAWVEGVKGYGIGEYIEFVFPPQHPRVTKVIIANGYVKSKKAWKDNARVKRFKMYVNEKPYAYINLKNEYTKQSFELPIPLGTERNTSGDYSKLPKWKIKLEIVEVYKGERYDDTVISDIYFDGLDVHCLTGETLITMSDYSTKMIKDVHIGDKIMSYNSIEKCYEAATVLELASPFHKDLMKINFKDGSSIQCTADHPFLSDKEEWYAIDASKTMRDYTFDSVHILTKGTRLKTVGGTTAEVSTIHAIQRMLQTYTIVALDINTIFIANGILTGTEQLRSSVDNFSEIKAIVLE